MLPFPFLGFAELAKLFAELFIANKKRLQSITPIYLASIKRRNTKGLFQNSYSKHEKFQELIQDFKGAFLGGLYQGTIQFDSNMKNGMRFWEPIRYTSQITAKEAINAHC